MCISFIVIDTSFELMMVEKKRTFKLRVTVLSLAGGFRVLRMAAINTWSTDAKITDVYMHYIIFRYPRTSVQANTHGIGHSDL